MKREKKTHHTLSDSCLVVFRSDTDDSIDLGSVALRSPLRANSLAEIIWMRVRARLSVRRGFGDARGARAGRSVTRADAGRRTRRTVTSPMSLAASVRAPPASSIRANRASLARSSSPLDGAIRLTERSTALFILLRHAQAAAARVAPRNGLSSRRRVATGTVALRAQPRSRTVARSAPYTPLKINAVRQRLVKPKTALGVTRRAPGECGEKSAAFFRAKRAHATTLRSRRDRFERSRSRPTLPSHAASLFSVPSRH